MMNAPMLHIPTPRQSREQRERAILDAAKPCPFCGSADLLVGSWILEDEDVDALECNCCAAGAPVIAWQQRTGNAA